MPSNIYLNMMLSGLKIRCEFDNVNGLICFFISSKFMKHTDVSTKDIMYLFMENKQKLLENYCNVLKCWDTKK